MRLTSNRQAVVPVSPSMTTQSFTDMVGGMGGSSSTIVPTARAWAMGEPPDEDSTSSKVSFGSVTESGTIHTGKGLENSPGANVSRPLWAK